MLRKGHTGATPYLCTVFSLHGKFQQHGLELEPRGPLVVDLVAQRTGFRKRHRSLSFTWSPGGPESARTPYALSTRYGHGRFGNGASIKLDMAHVHAQTSGRGN